MIGRHHPHFMGGEYLPTLEQDEIENARSACASMTQDVTSIRARRCNGRIVYRAVDEHDPRSLISSLMVLSESTATHQS